VYYLLLGGILLTPLASIHPATAREARQPAQHMERYDDLFPGDEAPWERRARERRGEAAPPPRMNVFLFLRWVWWRYVRGDATYPPLADLDEACFAVKRDGALALYRCSSVDRDPADRLILVTHYVIESRADLLALLHPASDSAFVDYFGAHCVLPRGGEEFFLSDVLDGFAAEARDPAQAARLTLYAEAVALAVGLFGQYDAMQESVASAAARRRPSPILIPDSDEDEHEGRRASRWTIPDTDEEEREARKARAARRPPPRWTIPDTDEEELEAREDRAASRQQHWSISDSDEDEREAREARAASSREEGEVSEPEEGQTAGVTPRRAEEEYAVDTPLFYDSSRDAIRLFEDVSWEARGMRQSPYSESADFFTPQARLSMEEYETAISHYEVYWQRLLNKPARSATRPQVFEVEAVRPGQDDRVAFWEQLKEILLDEEPQFVLKATPVGVSSALEIAHEIRCGFFLNELNFGYQHVLTPHFAQIADWWCAGSTSLGKGTVQQHLSPAPQWQFTVVERLWRTIGADILGGAGEAGLRARLFQVFLSLEVAWLANQYVHYDLHVENVFEKRLTSHSALYDKSLVYKRYNNDDEWYVLEAAVLGNIIIKVFDYGRNRMYVPYPGGDTLYEDEGAGEVVAHRHEALLFLGAYEKYGVTREPNRCWDVRRLLMQLIEKMSASEVDQMRAGRDYEHFCAMCDAVFRLDKLPEQLDSLRALQPDHLISALRVHRLTSMARNTRALMGAKRLVSEKDHSTWFTLYTKLICFSAIDTGASATSCLDSRFFDALRVAEVSNSGTHAIVSFPTADLLETVLPSPLSLQSGAQRAPRAACIVCGKRAAFHSAHNNERLPFCGQVCYQYKYHHALRSVHASTLRGAALRGPGEMGTTPPAQRATPSLPAQRATPSLPAQRLPAQRPAQRLGVSPGEARPGPLFLGDTRDSLALLERVASGGRVMRQSPYMIEEWWYQPKRLMDNEEYNARVRTRYDVYWARVLNDPDRSSTHAQVYDVATLLPSGEAGDAEDPALRARFQAMLLEERPQFVLKATPVPLLKRAVGMEVAHELRCAFFLNELNFGYEHVLTPHFMQIVDWWCVRGDEIEAGTVRGGGGGAAHHSGDQSSGEESLGDLVYWEFAVSERLDAPISASVTAGMGLEGLRHQLFQVLLSLEVAWLANRYLHYDLHQDNVFTKVVPPDSRLYGRNLIYKRFNNDAEWYRLEAAVLQGRIVKILDYGRNRMYVPTWNDGDRVREDEEGFLTVRHQHDELLFLDGFEEYGVTSEPNRCWDVRRLLLALLRALTADELLELQSHQDYDLFCAMCDTVFRFDALPAQLDLVFSADPETQFTRSLLERSPLFAAAQLSTRDFLAATQTFGVGHKRGFLDNYLDLVGYSAVDTGATATSCLDHAFFDALKAREVRDSDVNCVVSFPTADLLATGFPEPSDEEEGGEAGEGYEGPGDAPDYDRYGARPLRGLSNGYAARAGRRSRRHCHVCRKPAPRGEKYCGPVCHQFRRHHGCRSAHQ